MGEQPPLFGFEIAAFRLTGGRPARGGAQTDKERAADGVAEDMLDALAKRAGKQSVEQYGVKRCWHCGANACLPDRETRLTWHCIACGRADEPARVATEADAPLKAPRV